MRGSAGKVKCELLGHGHWVFACAFSPDGKTVLSGSADRTLRIWSVVNGEDSAAAAGSRLWIPA